MTGSLNAKQITRLKKRVTLIAALVNFFLSAIKISIGILGQSTALIADGIHSLSDLASDFLVLIAVKLGSHEADREHPYGHGRFETIATVLLGISLVAVAAGIAMDALDKVLNPNNLIIPSQPALGVAAISILANEWLFQYTKRISKLTRSKLLLANAWHHRSDALSSVIVLFGIAAVYFGFGYADAIAAIIVSLMVAKIGLNLVLESLKELVDTSLPQADVKAIKQSILATEGVHGIHFLRTREMGHDAFIDAHIVVNPKISVSEGHMIGDHVRDKLKAEFDNIIDVLVHIDPEDDQYNKQCNHTLTRQHILKLIEKYFGHLQHKVSNCYIHFHDGAIELEIIFEVALENFPNELEQLKKQSTLFEQEQELIRKVSILIQA